MKIFKDMDRLSLAMHAFRELQVRKISDQSEMISFLNRQKFNRDEARCICKWMKDWEKIQLTRYSAEMDPRLIHKTFLK